VVNDHWWGAESHFRRIGAPGRIRRLGRKRSRHCGERVRPADSTRRLLL